MFTPCRGVLGLTHLQEHTLAVVFLIRARVFRENVDSLALAVTRGLSAENGIRENKKQTTNRRSNRVSVASCETALPRRARPATAADLCRLHAALEHHFNLRFSCRMKCEDVYANIEIEFLPILQQLTGTCMCRI